MNLFVLEFVWPKKKSSAPAEDSFDEAVSNELCVSCFCDN